MCGIIGYCGKEPLPVLLTGLEALEYRGYDSAGVAVLDDPRRGFTVARAVGRVASLSKELCGMPRIDGDGECAGIGHTRWATHGAPSLSNCHPHGTEEVLIVHNGIIENHAEIRALLSAEGYEFESDTDTEAAAKLIDSLYKKGESRGDPVGTVFKAAEMMRGSFALGILFRDRPARVFAVRRQSPLIVARGEDGGYLASDVTAILGRAREFYRLPEGVVAAVSPRGAELFEGNARGYGRVTPPKAESLCAEVGETGRGGYESFMRKEISEVPSVLRSCAGEDTFCGLPASSLSRLCGELAKRVLGGGAVRLIGCGTAMHACLVGKHFIERLARVPASVEIASEFRYGEPILGEGDVCILLSQSGETADTIAACKYARERGAMTIALVNVRGSTLSLEADEVLYTNAGPEIAVASTKAYSLQCALLILVAVGLSLSLGALSEETAGRISRALSEEVPDAVEKALGFEEKLRALAESIKGAEHLFFIGRGLDYAVCLEGSLKLKEISYIHSEAYPSGELKHGTISLITDGVPVIALLTDAGLFEKSLSAIREVKSRGARVIALVSEDILKNEGSVGGIADEVIEIPSVGCGAPECRALSLFPAVSMLQLLALHTARALGYDVDKPRNLAKSVTVE